METPVRSRLAGRRNGAHDVDAGNPGPIKPLCPQPQVRYVFYLEIPGSMLRIAPE